MTETSFRAEFSGHIGDDKVAWTYRAYNEEGAPYVVILDSDPDARSPLIITQHPEADPEGYGPQEVEEGERTNAIAWVETLTELVAKARKWDQFLEDVAGGTDYYVDPVDGAEPGVDPYIVEALTESEDDAVWEDCDGDRYKCIDGVWNFLSHDTGEWQPLDEDEQSYLTHYAPYRAVSE